MVLIYFLHFEWPFYEICLGKHLSFGSLPSPAFAWDMVTWEYIIVLVFILSSVFVFFFLRKNGNDGV